MMADSMTFPKTWEQFLHDYEFEDSRRIYTNGARLIPSFRVKQMMEHYLLEAKSEAYKEFAERFKEKASSAVTSCQGYEIYETKLYQISAVDLDNLLKELTRNLHGTCTEGGNEDGMD